MSEPAQPPFQPFTPSLFPDLMSPPHLNPDLPEPAPIATIPKVEGDSILVEFSFRLISAKGVEFSRTNTNHISQALAAPNIAYAMGQFHRRFKISQDELYEAVSFFFAQKFTPDTAELRKLRAETHKILNDTPETHDDNKSTGGPWG